MHMNHLNEILAQAAAPAGQTPSTGSPLFGSPIVFIVLMVIMMYFILFRPQQQQRKRQEKMLQALKSGDKVVTSSGIIGLVITVKDKTVSLRSADAKMEVTKASVAEILESSSSPDS
jgi:preprotein translocase subunit YajC